MANIFEYSNHLDFLRDFLTDKSTQKAYSMRAFSQRAGFSSSGHLSMIMNGQRRLTPATISKLSSVMKLSAKERSYFEALALYNQAEDETQKAHYQEKLIKLRPKVNAKQIQQDQMEFFSKPYIVTIHQMILLGEFKEDPQWISSRLYPKIRSDEVVHAVAVLLRLGLVKRDELGHLCHAHESLATENEVTSHEIFNYHGSLLQTAYNALMKVPSDIRDITSLTIPLNFNQIPEIKSRIQTFREELISLINSYEKIGDEVFQINIQMYPATLKPRKVDGVEDEI